jgi:hypothetical protein
MRPVVKCGVFALILLIVCQAVNAQKNLQLNASYNINIPSGSFRDFINKTAYTGFTVGLAYPFSDQFSLGISVSHNDFYQKFPRKLYNDGKSTTISAVITNSVQQAPLLLTGNYTFLKQGVVRPYIGAGVGINFIDFDQYLGEFDDPQSPVKFALSGEAGVFIPLNTHTCPIAIKIGGSYNYAPLDKDKYGVSNLDNWGIHAGIRIGLK